MHFLFLTNRRLRIFREFISIFHPCIKHLLISTCFRTCTIALVCLYSASRLCAEIPHQVEWISQLGDSQSNSITVDNAGNVYIAGHTQGGIEGTTTGKQGAFFSKFSNSGTLLWTKQFGDYEGGSSNSITTDDQGNIYVTGSAVGDTHNNYDAFLSKYDSAGNLLWSELIGTDKEDIGYSVTVDGIGNAYISGTTNGNLGGTNAGSIDVFISQIDSSGNLLWTEQIGTSAVDLTKSIAVDAIGNTYIARNNGISSGVLLSKFDSSGNQLWDYKISDYDIYAYSMTAGKSGNIYLAGSISGYTEGTDAYFRDAFLNKFDSSGNLLWTSPIETDERDFNQYPHQVRVHDTVYSVAIDRAGNPYVTGTTEGDIDRRVTSAGHTDIFLSKFDRLGNQLWIEEIGTGFFERSLSVSIADTGSAYITGYTSGDLWSSYYEGIERSTSREGGKAFVVKFSSIPEPNSVLLLCIAGIIYYRIRRDC